MSLIDLFEKKRILVAEILEIVNKQNVLLNDNMGEAALEIDENKQDLLVKLRSIDDEISSEKESGCDVSAKISEINELLENLISIEKENDKIVSNMAEAASEKYLDMYSRYKKAF